MAYDSQFRGGDSAYAAYYASMDKSMRQKIALVTAHFPPGGRIVDMGCGSGSGSYDLARLYPRAEVVGVDISPQSVEYARGKYQSPNLSFSLGDIKDPLFPADSCDAILDCSVIHHVTSFNGFSLDPVRTLFDNQVRALRNGGILAIRDFVVPGPPRQVVLELPDADGMAPWFERFAKEFKSSLYPKGGVAYEELKPTSAGWRRFALDHRTATEFVLRKDYQADWAVEILEEYTYLDQPSFERELAQRGLKIMLSKPLFNPWIVENRFIGKFVMRCARTSEILPVPPTNYLMVAQKVGQGQGTHLRASTPSSPSGASRYVRLRHFHDAESNRTYDLAERPDPAVDILPWCEDAGEIWVVARQSYPRPILNVVPPEERLERAMTAGYAVEPIAAVGKFARSADVLRALCERAGLAPDLADATGVEKALTYYPSPGGIAEVVTSYHVRLPARPEPRWNPAYRPDFHTSGSLAVLNAEQTLRAATVGGLLDARLEMNVYDLLRRLGRSPGPWIGDELAGPFDHASLPSSTPAASSPLREVPTSANFLAVHTSSFTEHDHADREIARATFEYAAPRSLSLNTVSVLLYARAGGQIFVAVEPRRLPAPQLHEGNPVLSCAPAWRLPRGEGVDDAGAAFLRAALAREFNVKVSRLHRLGGAYAPTAGLTPEIVLPYAAPLPRGAESRGLAFVTLTDLLSKRHSLRDAHLIIAALRLDHALAAHYAGGSP